MKKYGQIVIAGLLIMCNTGCFSIYQLNSSKTEMRRMKIARAGNEQAIRAFALDGGVGIGFDVTNLEAIQQNPVKQIGAAGLDYLTYLGGKELYDKYIDKKDDSKNIYINLENSDNNQIFVNRDGTINYTINQYYPEPVK